MSIGQTFVAQGCLITHESLMSVWLCDIIITWEWDELVISFELKHTEGGLFKSKILSGN